MIFKMIGAVKAVFYSIRYGCRISFAGIPALYENTAIKIKQGHMLVGRGFSAKKGTYFAVVNNGRLIIKQGVSFGRGCITVCHDCISIGENVYIGPNVLIYDHDHKFDNHGVQEGFRTSPVYIEDNCWIGAGVIILRGTTIGEGCIIGAGCVVKGKIPPHSVVTSDRNLIIRPIAEGWATKGE